MSFRGNLAAQTHPESFMIGLEKQYVKTICNIAAIVVFRLTWKNTNKNIYLNSRI